MPGFNRVTALWLLCYLTLSSTLPIGCMYREHLRNMPAAVSK